MRWILGVLTVAVVVGVVATITVPAQTITPDQATLKLFPPETQGIGVVDVAGLRGSSLFNQLILQKAQVLPKQFNDFIEATGFDIRQDVDKVTAGRLGQKDGLVIIQARYDKFKLQQFIQDHSDQITTQTYLGNVIYTGNGNTDNSGGVCFLDNMIVAGSLTAVEAALDRVAAAAPSVVDNTDLMNAIRTIQTGNQVWAAGKFDPNMFGNVSNAPGQIGQLATSLQSGTYQMRMDQDVHVQANGVFNTPDTAKTLGDMLRGFLAMGKMQTAQQPAVAQLLNGVDVENDGVNLTVSFTASGDLLKQLQTMKSLPKMGR